MLIILFLELSTKRPTKVYKIDSVVLGGGEHIKIEPTKEGLGQLVDKLMVDHIFG